ncbi:MAG: DNA translocase FtsK, partial [Patescibacteria group bacterium]
MARGRRPAFKMKLKKQTVYGMVSVGLALGAVLALISLFYPSGGLLLKVNTVLQTYFDWLAFGLPAVLLLLAALLSRIKAGFAKLNFVGGIVVIWLSMLGIFSAGTIGAGIWQNLEIILPIPFVVFIVLVFIFLFGLTVTLNLSLGEGINAVIAAASAILNFTKKYFKFNLKKKEPVFIKDSQIQQAKIEPQKQVPVQMPMVKPVENSGESFKLWEYPPLDLLSDETIGQADRGDPNHYANVIEKTLDSFGITAKVAEVNNGPAVTQYALEIAQGTKIAKITSLQNDLALALAAPNGLIRI